MRKTLKEIATLVDGHLVGDPTLEIKGLAAVDHAQPGELTFAESAAYVARAQKSAATAVIVNQGVCVPGKAVIQTAHPKLAFGKLMTIFHPPVTYPPGVHPTAVIAPDAQVGEQVHIGAHVVIAAGVHIGAHSVLCAGVVVGEKCQIGQHVLIHPNVTLYPQVQIADRVIIHAGSVIGSDGFGYVQQDGRHIKIPQVGTVVIEEDVEIGSNVSIDRGTIGPTTIKKGTKIDNLVQIAHNCTLGQCSILAAQVGISGSVTIGDHTVLLGQVGITQGVKVGDQVLAGARTAIWKDIPSKQIVLGATGPYPHREYKRQVVALEKLPHALKDLKNLIKRVEKLESPESM